MVPVLGRVASGMWQVARAELQQDLDSTSDGSAQCSAVSPAGVQGLAVGVWVVVTC